MELSDTTQQALGAALRGAQARHTALAANIANATTPGYARVDVDFHTTLQAALATGQKPRDLAFSVRPDRSVGVTKADGGSIDIDAESAKLAANSLEYNALVAVKEARGKCVKAALGVQI